jgi:hypothetical protein
LQVLQLRLKDRGLTGSSTTLPCQHRVTEASERIGPMLDRLIECARHQGRAG